MTARASNGYPTDDHVYGAARLERLPGRGLVVIRVGEVCCITVVSPD